jgi:hypothetical protein
MLLGAKAGDVLWYFETDKGVSINPIEISVQKYKEMLVTTAKDVFEVLGIAALEK